MIKHIARHTPLRAAVKTLAELARKHPETGGGKIAMSVIVSTAFRVKVPIDLGRIATQLSPIYLKAVMTIIHHRHSEQWPTDLLPDDEVIGWIEHWKIKFAEA